MADDFRDIHNGDKSNSIFWIKKTGRLKPRLYRQNPPPWVEEQEIKIMLFYSVRGGGLRLTLLAVSTAVLILAVQKLINELNQIRISEILF